MPQLRSLLCRLNRHEWRQVGLYCTTVEKCRHCDTPRSAFDRKKLELDEQVRSEFEGMTEDNFGMRCTRASELIKEYLLSTRKPATTTIR